MPNQYFNRLGIKNNELYQLLRRHWVFLLLLVICIGLRLLILLNYQPILYPDSQGYKNLAYQLKTLNFSSYLGERPPVYSLLLMLSGMNDYAIWAIQSILGIAVSILLYFIALQLTGNKSLSFIIGLSYSLAIQLLFFESIVLTETLTTFLIILSLWLLLVAFDKKSISLYLLTGFVIGLSILTRPILLFLSPLIVIFIFFKLKIAEEATSEILRIVSGLLIPMIILIGGWSLFNKVKVDYFGITTLFGYNLTNHSGAFMQNAPPEYSVLRDVYLKHKGNAESQVAIIWGAIPDMQQATGLTFSELSRALAKMSIQMFIENPRAYLMNVFEAWNDFWEPVFWYADYDLIRSVFFRKIVSILLIFEESLFTHLNSIFLLVAAWTIVNAILRPKILDFNLLFILIVLIASILQALLEFGENSRYAIPFQPLIFLEVITWLYYLFTIPLEKGKIKNPFFPK
jgi:4-amino-4-deoxy-L-arabinose transferase-like glycosyltransferase